MNNQSKAAFLSKPNITISQTAEDLPLTLGRLASGNYSGREQIRGLRREHTRPGLGIDDSGESLSKLDRLSVGGAPIHQSRSFQRRLDQYIQGHERDLSFSDSPHLPHELSPTNIQSTALCNSSSDVLAFDHASGGATNGQRKEEVFGTFQYDDHSNPSSTVANPPQTLQHRGLQNTNNLRQIAYFSGIPTMAGDQSLFMQPNGTFGVSTWRAHHMPGMQFSGPSLWGPPYISAQNGLPTDPFTENALYPYSVPIHQQNIQPHFATGVYLPQNGHQPGSLPPFGVPNSESSGNTTSSQLSPPDSHEQSPEVGYHQPAVSDTQASGAVHIAANGQPPLPSFVQRAITSPSISAFVPPVVSNGHAIAHSAPIPIPKLVPTPAGTPAAPDLPAASTQHHTYPQPLPPSMRLNVSEPPHQHMDPAAAKQSNEAESENQMKVYSEETYGPRSQSPSPNANPATPTEATQAATYSFGSLSNREETCQTGKNNGVSSQTALSHHGFTARVSTALAAQSKGPGQDTSTPPVERALTNAQRLAMKLARADLAAKNNSEETKAVDQGLISLNSDVAQWPTLGESFLMGQKGKTNKRTKQGLKLGDIPGPELYQGPNLGTGSSLGLPYLPAGLRAKMDWNSLRQRMTTELSANPEDNSYFASTGSAPLAKDKDGLAKLFDKYRDSKGEEDKLDVNGTLRYLQDLGLNIETAEIFVPLEIVQAPSLSELPKDAFVDGWKKHDADTIAKQRLYVAGQIKQLSVDMALFKRVYRHVFICSRDPGQKALPLESAIIYWELVFSPPGKPWVTGTGSATTNWLSLWVEFLKANWTKTVNKDMWNQTFEFFLKTMQDETLSFWSEDGAWPGVIDEFVAYVKEKRGDLPDTMETD